MGGTAIAEAAGLLNEMKGFSGEMNAIIEAARNNNMIDEAERNRLNHEVMSGVRQGEKISAAELLGKNRARQIAREHVDEVKMYNAVGFNYGIERNPISKDRLGGPTARKLRKQGKRLDQVGDYKGDEAHKCGDKGDGSGQSSKPGKSDKFSGIGKRGGGGRDGRRL